jgi:hypothetical protein
MLCRETRAGKLEATLAGGADCGRMTGKHFVSNQRPMSPERPVWVRSRVGVFTTAYRRGPEVLGLYRKRPLRGIMNHIGVRGRFRYSDLKEAAGYGI